MAAPSGARTAWWALLVLPALLVPLASHHEGAPAAARRPNVLLIITDDQGYGDLGLHRNPRLHTPHLDRLARDGVRFERFYVAPVCSPTRASLLTGRYNYRTGVVDTYLGRSLMHPDETTIAEMLGAAGYRTGIFGKWHLGDNYPLRAMDQGFQDTLTLNGGGIGQPSDPPGGESYFDPMLRQNGRWVKHTGYVSDVITDAAIEFIDRNRARPFFAYLSFNAPHTPLQAPPELYEKYRAMDLTWDPPTGRGHPVQKFDPDTTAKIYAMVENIDENVGRVLAKLDELKLTEDTLVIFLTDNGPQQPRYNAGMLRLKGTVHEGGIRVPFFVRWPGRAPAGRIVQDRIAAHIDVTPTILGASGVTHPRHIRFDGVSLLPLLGDGDVPWPERSLFFQWHRGDMPELGRAFAVRSDRYKLVQPQGNGEKPPPVDAPLLLYDMRLDPLEERDVAADHPGVVASLREEYARWFRDVTAGRDYTDSGIPRLALGAPQENPVRLTRQDWRGPRAGWTPQSIGYWLVDVRRGGRYQIAVRIAPLTGTGVMTVSVGAWNATRDVPAATEVITFDNARLATGPATLAVEIEQSGQIAGAVDVVVRRR